jgi:hypothetical protein
MDDPQPKMLGPRLPSLGHVGETGACFSPFYGLASFTSWTAEDDAPVIERHHVLRCNASSCHWELAAATLSGKARIVSSISSYLRSHLSRCHAQLR